MRTEKIVLRSIKDPDGWGQLAFKLKFEKFKKDNPNISDDELHDKFYKEVISEKFEWGEYADIEIIVDENFNIVGGKII